MEALKFLLILIWATIITSCMKENSNENKCGVVLNKTATGINIVYPSQQISFFERDTSKFKINQSFCDGK